MQDLGGDPELLALLSDLARQADEIGDRARDDPGRAEADARHLANRLRDRAAAIVAARLRCPGPC